jgi:hypothetical protein
MDLSQLRDMGLVSASPLVRKEITIKYHPLLPKEQWADPEIPERQAEPTEGKLTFWVRKKSAADEILISEARNAGRDPLYTLIHRCVFNEKGGRVFPTEEDAIGLDLTMFAPLLEAINEVNGPAKKSRPRTKSGVSSPSPSAEGQSKNGESGCQPMSSAYGSSTEGSGDR